MINPVSMLRKVFGALANKVATEPVFLSGLAIIALTGFNEAQSAGLTVEDSLLFAIEGILTLLARQLVWPAIKIDAATQTPKVVEQPLDAPFLGGPSE